MTVKYKTVRKKEPNMPVKPLPSTDLKKFLLEVEKKVTEGTKYLEVSSYSNRGRDRDSFSVRISDKEFGSEPSFFLAVSIVDEMTTGLSQVSIHLYNKGESFEPALSFFTDDLELSWKDIFTFVTSRTIIRSFYKRLIRHFETV